MRGRRCNCDGDGPTMAENERLAGDNPYQPDELEITKSCVATEILPSCCRKVPNSISMCSQHLLATNMLSPALLGELLHAPLNLYSTPALGPTKSKTTAAALLLTRSTPAGSWQVLLMISPTWA